MQSSFTVFVRAAVMLGVLVVLPAYALLGTTLPEKLLPLIERLANQNRSRTVEQEPPAPRSVSKGSGPYHPAAAVWLGDAAVGRPPRSDDTPSRLAPLPNRPSENRQVSWEEASPRPPPNLSLRQLPEGVATVRVHGDGRQVLSSDGFAELERALREEGTTKFWVSVENSATATSYWCTCQVVDRRDRFEASAADALGAMEAVLRQIRAWRSAGETSRR